MPDKEHARGTRAPEVVETDHDFVRAIVMSQPPLVLSSKEGIEVVVGCVRLARRETLQTKDAEIASLRERVEDLTLAFSKVRQITNEAAP